LWNHDRVFESGEEKAEAGVNRSAQTLLTDGGTAARDDGAVAEAGRLALGT